jgi:hypothetical protein|tara:strand:+ start:2889 stop:3449 length:561 start_codon:yes stop_codon:yes gene_type:complete
MAKQYKSVLEKYNKSLKPRRLPTAEEEAIEPVYPEEYLMGGPGKFAASGLRSSAEKAAAKAAQRERIAQIKIGSRVPSPEAVAAEKAVSDKFYKTKWGQATYEDLRNKAEQAAKQQIKQDVIDQIENSGKRATNNFYGEAGNAIGNEMYEQRQNAAGDTYKKGGKVSASSRGDGIAQRGKTKGRLL